ERPSLWKRILQPVPITAFAVALLSTGFSGYQTLAMHELKAATMAQLVTTKLTTIKPVFLGQPRDSEEQPVNVAKGDPFQLAYSLAPAEQSDFYEIKVSTLSGSTKFFKKASAGEVGDRIRINFLTGWLEPGEYVFTL